MKSSTYVTAISFASSNGCRRLAAMAFCGAVLLAGLPRLRAGETPNAAATPQPVTCTVIADERVQDPVTSIVNEYQRRTGATIRLECVPAKRLNDTVAKKTIKFDVAVCLEGKDETCAVADLDGAKKIAWKHPGGHPVWAAALTDGAKAAEVFGFLGGPSGHRLWSKSPAGFTMTSGKTHAEAFNWVVENRVKHTYPMTAMRMLRECGGIRKGTCIEIGCGTGPLAVELAKRSELTMIGLDIDADMQPLYEKTAREAGMSDRLRFVEGDAQDLPFPDNSADIVVSRGTLTFIPDIGKCLREVRRVLKPEGVAFLGGRYLYTPHKYEISNEKLKQIVRDSGVEDAQVILDRGQWVKIVGPQAPEAARNVATGPHLLAGRFIADYVITTGDCLILCRGDGGLEQGLQRGFLEMTDLKMTALYPKAEVAEAAEKRIKEAGHADRIACRVGTIYEIPTEDDSFDVVAGVGPILIWGDHVKGMREVHRVLRPGGAALVGGKYKYMPEFRKVPSEKLRESAAKTGISSIRVIDDMGQWVEVRKGIKDRGLSD
jgi:ubiquinone/menaquinone biosynthesis C-methylase UbiE